MAVNNVVYDYQSIDFNVPGVGSTDRHMAINYDAERDGEPVNDSKGDVVGETRGDYKGSFDCEIALAAFAALTEARKGNGGVLGGEPYSVMVSYGFEGEQAIEDTLTVRVKKVSKQNKKGTDELVVKLEGFQLGIADFGGTPVLELDWQGSGAGAE